MTREEAIENLKGLLESNYVDSFEDEENEALEMAIQALSQKPTKREIEREYLFQSLCEDFKKLQAENDDLRKRLEREPCDDATLKDIFCTGCEYKEQKPCDDAVSRDFEIGDEVRIIGSDPIYDDCDVGWVIRNASEKFKTMYVMRNDGSAGEEAKAEWYKTGRHNAMLAEVIKALPSVNSQIEHLPKYEYEVGYSQGYKDGQVQKSGKWKSTIDGKPICSECGFVSESEDGYFVSHYCPNCGAKMESEEEQCGK